MRVGAEGQDATLANALSEAGQFGLTQAEARREAGAVTAVCADWRPHFETAGVTTADLEQRARRIDRPSLLDMRAAAMV